MFKPGYASNYTHHHPIFLINIDYKIFANCLTVFCLSDFIQIKIGHWVKSFQQDIILYIEYIPLLRDKLDQVKNFFTCK